MNKILSILLLVGLAFSACKTNKNLNGDQTKETQKPIQKLDKKNRILEGLLQELGLPEAKETKLVTMLNDMEEQRAAIHTNKSNRHNQRSQLMKITQDQNTQAAEILSKKQYEKYIAYFAAMRKSKK